MYRIFPPVPKKENTKEDECVAEAANEKEDAESEEDEDDDDKEKQKEGNSMNGSSVSSIVNKANALLSGNDKKSKPATFVEILTEVNKHSNTLSDIYVLIILNGFTIVRYFYKIEDKLYD